MKKNLIKQQLRSWAILLVVFCSSKRMNKIVQNDEFSGKRLSLVERCLLHKSIRQFASSRSRVSKGRPEESVLFVAFVVCLLLLLLLLFFVLN